MSPRVASLASFSTQIPIIWVEKTGWLEVLVTRPLDNKLARFLNSKVTEKGAEMSKDLAVNCVCFSSNVQGKQKQCFQRQSNHKLGSKSWKYWSRETKLAQEAPAQPV